MESRIGVTRVVGALSVILLYFAVALPVVWLLYLSIQSSYGLGTASGGLSVQPWLRFLSSSYLRATANSALISVVTACITVALGLALATRLRLPSTSRRLRTSLGDTVLFARILPVAVLTPAIIWILRPAGLVDVVWLPVLLYVPGLLLIPTALCSLALRRVSAEHLEAVRVEGWTQLQMYRHLIIPIAQPHILASLMICYCTVWNEFLLQTLLTDTTPSQTLTVMLANAIGQYSIDYPLLAVGGLVSLLPSLVVTALLWRSYSLHA